MGTIISQCCVCEAVYKIKEYDSVVGTKISHGYCTGCLKAEMIKIKPYNKEEQHA